MEGAFKREPFCIGGGKGHPSDTYHLNTVRTEWSYNHWEPQDRGTDDFAVEQVLNRLNLEKSVEGIEYIGLPNRNRVTTYGYHLECMISGALARSSGWVKSYDRTPQMDNNVRWGWGLMVIIRDWAADTLKKVCIEANVASLLEAGYFLERTQLFRGSETMSPGGSNRDYLYRLPTTDWSIVMGNGGTSQKKSDPSAKVIPGKTVSKMKKDGEDGVKEVSQERDVSKHSGEKAKGVEPAKEKEVTKLTPKEDEKKTGSGVIEIKKKTEEEAKGAGLTRGMVGGKPTGDDVRGSGLQVKERKETKKIMVTAEPQAKLGTTKELAAIHPDHRKKQDET